MIKIGNIDVSDFKIGTANVESIAIGSEEIWNSNAFKPRYYLTFISTSTNTISLREGSSPFTKKREFWISFDASRWTLWDWAETQFSNAQPIYIAGMCPDGTADYNSNAYTTFSIGGSGLVSCSGNIMSIINCIEPPTNIPSSYCFKRLFLGCTNLVTAPELPAQQLTVSCYEQLFFGCESLRSVKCLATTFATKSIDAWLSMTSQTGVFIKAHDATWESGASGIPEGWTIVEEVNYVWAVGSKWNGRKDAAWGWMQILPFTLDIDSVKFFVDAESGFQYGCNTTGDCLCTARSHSACTVQDHIGGTNPIMLTTRVYDSSNVSSGDYRTDFRVAQAGSTMQYSIQFTRNTPAVIVDNFSVQQWWNTGSSARYNAAREYRDSSAITYVRFSFGRDSSSNISRKIHKFYVINNHTKVIDVVPIIINATSKYGLYDKVSGNYIDSIATDKNYVIEFNGE